MNRLHLVALRLPTALASAAFIATPSLAPAQEFPVKTLRIVTATAAGGSSDILARLFAGKLTEHYKPHTVIVENRASATGVLAGEMVANAAPDGHTLLLSARQLQRVLQCLLGNAHALELLHGALFGLSLGHFAYPHGRQGQVLQHSQMWK